MPQDSTQQPNPRRPVWRTAIYLALVCISSLSLGGCYKEFTGFDCKHVSGNLLQVAPDAKCRFRYSHGDMAKYTVSVTRSPIHGQAKGQGPFLHYVAKPGFKGEDHLSIKVERRGVGGNVQWQTYVLKIMVGSNV